MELSALANPPPPAEPLVQTTVSPASPVTAGELILSIETRFTPARVGSTVGTSAVTLYGQLGAEREHPGSDYQCTELGAHIGLQRVRLGRYRWLLNKVELSPPCVALTVDRVAAAPRCVLPALTAGDECTFWLSTLGVDDLEIETRTNPRLPVYQDYVEISLWSYAESTYSSWPAYLRARRVLASFENVYWERKIDLGRPDSCSAKLGEHHLELLEVVWGNDRAPIDVHARFRLARGATAEGMTRSPPLKPFVPFIPR